MISAMSLLLIILAYVGLLYVIAAPETSAESGSDSCTALTFKVEVAV
ncbi:hypothetical protein Sps_04794 [Shewanella psychrophila]|uniref:Uncharacterized protein n=1 Tax=Shewanella psychrophila TaxID=225848 RepID=A0A1S6HWC1_9GAMM|nr:hypothetical protein [Shewanella psychrophila]AQS39876.1 hypothetical protein Sps_04794 [Shewanella psychrophila]